MAGQYTDFQISDNLCKMSDVRKKLASDFFCFQNMTDIKVYICSTPGSDMQQCIISL